MGRFADASELRGQASELRSSYLGGSRGSRIVIQLLAAAFMVILLNELAQKGYGVGNAISLFIVTNLGEQIKWKSMSPRAIDLGNGGEAASGRTCYGQSGSQSQHVLTSLMHFDVESLGSMAVYAVSTW